MMSKSEDLPVLSADANMQSAMTSQSMKCVVCQKEKLPCIYADVFLFTNKTFFLRT